MKRLYFAALLLSAATSLFAQNKLTYAVNGLNIGDVRNMKQIEHMDQGNGGANQVWNFASAKETKSMDLVQNENVAVQIGNLDLSSRNTLLACDEGGEKTTYFEITPTEKKYWGLTNGNVTISFNQPIVDLKFPFAYNEEIDGTMDGTYVDGNASFPITGTYITKADAYGTLSLPDGNTYNNVLRVKVDKNYEQSSNGTTYTIHTIRYQYFAEGLRYPVLIVLENEVNSDCHCACGNYKNEQAYYLPVSQSLRSESIAKVNENKTNAQNSVKVSVYPNPFKDNVNAVVNLTNATEANVDIIDAAGRKIKDFGQYNLTAGSNNISLEASDIIAGHYYLRVTVDGINYAKGIVKK